jgi:hypothetical protein
MNRAFLVFVSALVLAPASAIIAWSSEKAPAAVQAEFSAFLTTFKSAIKANDAKAVADLATLPFQDDPAVSNAAQFKATIYAESFTRQNRACLLRGKAIYDRDQENNDVYLVFCGELIFTFTRTPAGFRFTDIAVND